MNAAQALFLEAGFAATSIDAITTASGVAKGTFYLHFSTKEAVLFALRDRYVARFAARVREDCDEAKARGWSAWLDAWIISVAINFFAEPKLHHLVFHAVGGPDLATIGRSPLVDLLADGLIEGSKEDAWNVPDARATAVMIFHAVHGAVDEVHMRGERDPATSVIRMVSCFVRNAMRLR